MVENVQRFFALYDADPALRERVAQAVSVYPGSLELREALAEETLLPIARELGLEFTIQELRAYETRKKLERNQGPIPEGNFEGYWLLDRGWTNDEAVFCGDGK